DLDEAHSVMMPALTARHRLPPPAESGGPYQTRLARAVRSRIRQVIMGGRRAGRPRPRGMDTGAGKVPGCPGVVIMGPCRAGRFGRGRGCAVELFPPMPLGEWQD